MYEMRTILISKLRLSHQNPSNKTTPETLMAILLNDPSQFFTDAFQALIDYKK